MTREPSDVQFLVGLFRVRDHCIFTWRRREGSDRRTVVVHEHHCASCVAEVVRQGFDVVPADKPLNET